MTNAPRRAASISSRWKLRQRFQPVSRRCKPMAIPSGEPMRNAFAWFLGSNDLAIPLRWISTRAAAGTDYPSGPSGTEAAILESRICLDWPRCARWLVQATIARVRGAAGPARMTIVHQHNLFRPDPARVVVSFRPATEPRDFNATG